jgi:phosphorylase kinase alpha/beta subunit
LYEQIELLHTLVRLKGLNFDTGFGGAEETVKVVDLLNEVYTKAGESSQSKINGQSSAMPQVCWTKLISAYPMR